MLDEQLSSAKRSRKIQDEEFEDAQGSDTESSYATSAPSAAPSGSGSEGSCSGSAASLGTSAALAQLHQLVVKLVNRMDVVEERLDNVPRRMDLHIQQCQTVFDDAVALVSNTLDVVAALPDGQEAKLDEGALRSAGWAPTGLQSVFPTFPAFPIPDGVKMVAEAAAIAAPKPGSVRAAVRRHEARTQLLAAGSTRWATV